MSDSSTCCRLSATSKQKVSWWVLFALLFIQIKVAVGGCLISDVLPPPQPTMQMQMQATGEPCTEHNSPEQRLCVKHCVQNSDALKLTLDLPIFAPAVIPSSLQLFAVADVVSFDTTKQSPATAGPPPYLRFLRLLN